MRFSGYILFIGIKLRVMSLGCARATSKVLEGGGGGESLIERS